MFTKEEIEQDIRNAEYNRQTNYFDQSQAFSLIAQAKMQYNKTFAPAGENLPAPSIPANSETRLYGPLRGLKSRDGTKNSRPKPKRYAIAYGNDESDIKMDSSVFDLARARAVFAARVAEGYEFVLLNEVHVDIEPVLLGGFDVQSFELN